MPDLNFRITGVEVAARGLTPLLHFKLRIEAADAETSVRGLLLNAQIQIQCPQRAYSAEEKERLRELFGPPQAWARTLRNRLWTHAQTTVGAFTGAAEVILPVQCTYDLNIASAKYFYALDQGEVPLLFLFSGSVFYLGPENRLQIEQVSWNKECVHSIPIGLWRSLMQEHYPNSAWLSLPQDVFDRLYAFRRRNGLAGWEQTIEHLLRAAAEPIPPTDTLHREAITA